MTCSWPKSLDTLYGAAEIMAKNVAEATDNKFQIQVFAGGEIVPGAPGVGCCIKRHRRNRTLSVLLLLRQRCRTFAFGTLTVAFGPNERQNQAWMIHGGGMDLLNNFYKKFNVTALMAANAGCQMGGCVRKEINTVDDLQGAEFLRVGGTSRARFSPSFWSRAAANRWCGTFSRHSRRAPLTPRNGSGS